MLHATKANEIAKQAQFSQLESRIKAEATNGATTIISIDLSQENRKILAQHGYKVTKNPTDMGFKISWKDVVVNPTSLT